MDSCVPSAGSKYWYVYPSSFSRAVITRERSTFFHAGQIRGNAKGRIQPITIERIVTVQRLNQHARLRQTLQRTINLVQNHAQRERFGGRIRSRINLPQPRDDWLCGIKHALIRAQKQRMNKFVARPPRLAAQPREAFGKQAARFGRLSRRLRA